VKATPLFVLWDIDGTLLHAGGFGWHLMSTVFSQLHGFALGEAVALAGRTDRAIVTEALARHGIETDTQIDALIAAIGELAEATAPSVAADVARRGGGVLAGAGEAIAALAAVAGVVQSVLSGNIAKLGAAKLGAFADFDPLDLTIGAFGDDHLVRADLVGEARQRFGRRFGVDPAHVETVLIGDTPLDVEAAQLSGARIVAVATGRYGPAELAAAGAPIVLNDLRDTDAVVAAVIGRP
jgi:phosphoglycolate phosphatase